MPVIYEAIFILLVAMHKGRRVLALWSMELPDGILLKMYPAMSC